MSDELKAVLVTTYDDVKGTKLCVYETKELYLSSDFYKMNINHQIEEVTFFKEQIISNTVLDALKAYVLKLQDELVSLTQQLSEKADAKVFEAYLEQLESRLFQQAPAQKVQTDNQSVAAAKPAQVHTMGDMLQSHVQKWTAPPAVTQQQLQAHLPKTAGVIRPVKKN